jgi:hypothetical protein
MTSFSERIGLAQSRTALQIGGMDDPLRNALWNVVEATFLAGRGVTNAGDYGLPYRTLWDEFFHRTIDSIPFAADAARAEVRSWYFQSALWWQVYDFLQFAADYYSDEKPSVPVSELARSLRVPGMRKSPREIFTGKCNAVLEREMSGYRFVGGNLIPLSDNAQIEAISAARQSTLQDSFQPARAHLDTALRLFADRQNPSYRNVIKESMLAVEAVAQVVAGRPNATLADALKRIDEAVGVHAALNQGFQKIYGYTSDADGIRHALSEQEQLQQEDAQFMLVSCSAFVSYLIAKAARASAV